MEHVLNDLKAHGLQNRTVAVIENGTWGVVAGKQMKEILSDMKNMNILEQTVTVKSALKDDEDAQLEHWQMLIVASFTVKDLASTLENKRQEVDIWLPDFFGYWEKQRKISRCTYFMIKRRKMKMEQYGCVLLSMESPSMAEVISFFTGEKVLKNGSKENWSSWDCRFLYQRQKKARIPGQSLI